MAAFFVPLFFRVTVSQQLGVTFLVQSILRVPGSRGRLMTDDE